MESIRLMRVAWLERAFNSLNRIARRRGNAANLPAHLVVGIEGEDAVLFFLRRKGYTVVARRWSSGDVPGDVDLIAWDGPMLCFIEVKTRTAHDLTPAEVAVDEHKRNVLRRLARRYVRQLPQTDRAAGAFRCRECLPGARTGTGIPALRRILRLGRQLAAAGLKRPLGFLGQTGFVVQCLRPS